VPNFVKIAYGDIPLWVKFIPKKYHFCRYFVGARLLFKVTTVKFGMRVQIWDFLDPRLKFCIKNRLQGYNSSGQIYTEITNFGDFWLLKPLF